MKYALVRPCAKCPFRRDIAGYLHPERALEIATSEEPFACHETTVYDEETDEMEVTKESQHCAGALILAEKLEQPNQMMRIAERLGLYDHRRLDLDAPVFDTPAEMAAHHRAR